MNLENSVLNEITQPQKDRSPMIHLTWVIEEVKLTETKSTVVLVRTGAKEQGSCCYNEYKSPVTQIISGDRLYNMLPSVNGALSCTWKFVKKLDLMLGVLGTIKKSHSRGRFKALLVEKNKQFWNVILMHYQALKLDLILVHSSAFFSSFHTLLKFLLH